MRALGGTLIRILLSAQALSCALVLCLTGLAACTSSSVLTPSVPSKPPAPSVPSARPAPSVPAAPAPSTPVVTLANASPQTLSEVSRYRWFNRITWGASPSLLTSSISLDAYLAQQLHPAEERLPEAISTQIKAMGISQRPIAPLLQDIEKRRKDSDTISDPDSKKAAQQTYQQELNTLSREAATRHVLRALYSPNQVQTQMIWFWLNHFNVYQYKSNIRGLIGDYEDSAIRPHALGKFRDLLGAVAYHPAMLRYLDNEQNGLDHINENFARELMELHTLGVQGGYSQGDVQELARVLTGVGINTGVDTPKMRRELQPAYVRRGLFEFNPARHDYGPKRFLGRTITAKGLGELEEALDRLSRHPATAQFVCNKLAQYWLADDPPQALVKRMRDTFLRTNGDIAQVLQVLLGSPAFKLGATPKFKDPMHYIISAVRLAYDDKPILNANPIINWLTRMSQPMYGHQTPDGYALDSSAWVSPGQMAARFEIAKAIGSGNAGLFRIDGPQPQERAAFPQLSNALYFQSIRYTLSAATQRALDQATSPQEWNTFLLASPEMMNR